MLLGKQSMSFQFTKQDVKMLTLAALIAVAACAPLPETKITQQDDGAVFSGVIDSSTLDSLRTAFGHNPKNKTLTLQNVPGSVDDEASLKHLTRFVRDNRLTTRVPASGVIASGGTDLALMGVTRVIEPGACIGVHTWAAGGIFGSETGAELPQDDPSHELYLSFYKEIGISEEFYWFTLAAAGPDDVHWMTEEEINQYGLSSKPITGSRDETPQERTERCFNRL